MNYIPTNVLWLSVFLFEHNLCIIGNILDVLKYISDIDAIKKKEKPTQ